MLTRRGEEMLQALGRGAGRGKGRARGKAKPSKGQALLGDRAFLAEAPSPAGTCAQRKKYLL